ncbi:biotin--[acetyl-CoA-carboxylase] ligase [Flavobacterium sp.]|uniref:biotin--[acetyl-CoA-carboxylase] ligase n=1 Tax=Flavobacterium sp. TaxID=239 RepID=UPI002622413B|nr:biotin--[acetyl-CoA-carboxylase] ligase [Flavobacterium sp.]
MQLIKLDATDSTNDFLKALTRSKQLENFTTVLAQNQTNGKGQRGARWISEPGSNLIMSVLIQNNQVPTKAVFHLNVAIATSLLMVLQRYHIPDLSIKWPNDILSGNQKLGGILIENLIKSDQSWEAIVGIGLNVHQKDFKDLPKATSLYTVSQQSYDIEQLAQEIIAECQANYPNVVRQEVELMWGFYHDHLFRKGVPSAFELPNGQRFMGKILEVTLEGQLVLEDQWQTIRHFDVKEIQLLY